jgi:demethylmenaquinone methyltransferase/2-methoxy-6-polyprenyl-1,4-benzoquinol methylase
MRARKKDPVPQDNPEAGWFGYKSVRPEDKTSLVRGVFDSVAGKYDVMNDMMSLGVHRLWKDILVSKMNPRKGQVILDVAGGTGDIALRCHRRSKGLAAITVCDINPAMIEQGKAKAIDQGVLKGIRWITGNAEALPIADRSVDLYSIAFGLRNVTRIDLALQEAHRVLKPGGQYFCLEFSPGVAAMLKKPYELYSFSILPWLGEKIAKDRASYQYLAESIRQFPDQPSFAARLQKAGFEQVQWQNLAGGIAVIHSAWRL